MSRGRLQHAGSAGRIAIGHRGSHGAFKLVIPQAVGADSEVEAGEAGSDSDSEPPGDWKESKKQRRRRKEAEKKADRRGKKDKKKRKVSHTTRMPRRCRMPWHRFGVGSRCHAERPMQDFTGCSSASP